VPSYQPAAYVPVYQVAPVAVLPMPCVPQLPPATAPRPRVLPGQPQPLATPLPAPPPSSREPPTGSPPAPIITESRSLGGSRRPAPAGLAAGRVRVGFWNATGRDLTLTIDGRPRTLARDRAVTLDVDRTFVWRVDDGAAKTEQVPTQERTFEVIIRP
jgi:hypothetical protein